MPRRNTDSGKRSSSGPRRKSTSPRETSRGKSFKSGRDNRNASSSARAEKKGSGLGSSRSRGGTSTGRPFRKYEASKDDFGKTSSSDGARGRSFKSGRDNEKDSGSGRSERKASGAGNPRSTRSRTTTGRPFRKYESSKDDLKKTSSEEAGGKSFSQRSRFAKDPAKRSSSEEQNRGRKRPESFGKPYKKNYRPRADNPLTSSRARTRNAEEVAAPKSDKVRLNKFIANSGVSSRREADELIKLGLISVNGNVITELGYKVNPGDEVRYESKVLRAEKPVYILMNKPKGFITTTDDPHERKTVMHIIGSAVKERIYPVGRLDRNTTGLLLLTNDGDLADKLMHPSFNVKKVYKVELDRALTKGDFQKIIEGVRLEEGRATVDDLAIVSEDGRTVGIELHIGWNRVVRRIFEALGYEVLKLDRTVYAGLDKKELARGQWRFLSKEEIIHLKHFK